MSLSLFNAIPAGAIEVLTDATGAPHFKRADLGRFLGIVNIRSQFSVVTVSRSKIAGGGVGSNYTLLEGQNDHDVFVDLDAALEIVVRSKKPKAVDLVRWLTRKGVEKVVQEKQREIDERDMQLALLDDDLTLEQENSHRLGLENAGLERD